MVVDEGGEKGGIAGDVNAGIVVDLAMLHHNVAGVCGQDV